MTSSLIPHPSSLRVAVIGGGWSGLAAAVELAAAGVPVSVFEAAKQLGGRARRVEHRGLALDNGCHILLGAYRETLRLIDLVSSGQAARGLMRLPLELAFHGRFALRALPLPAPFHMLGGLLGARGLPLRQKLAAARFMSVQRRAGFRLAGDDTVEALLARHGQTGAAAEYLWRPLCVAALNTPAEAASAQVFLNVLRDGLDGSRAASDLLLPRQDLSALFPDRAAAFLAARGAELRLGCTVEALASTARGLKLGAGGETMAFSHVVCAVPPGRAAGLLEPLPGTEEAVALLHGFRYLPIHSVFLQYPGAVALPRPMLGLAGGLGQWTFDRGQLCGQRGLLAVVISGPGPHETMTQNELARRVHEQLRGVLLRLPEPLWQRVIAEKRATFACTPGLRRPPQRLSIPGLFLAGDYTEVDYPATIEAAVRSGVQCARLILDESRVVSR